MSERSPTLKILCQTLKRPTGAREATRLTDEAVRPGLGPLTDLIGVREAEVHEREARRVGSRKPGFRGPRPGRALSFAVARRCPKPSCGNWPKATIAR
jgi:hypothetical protein